MPLSTAISPWQNSKYTIFKRHNNQKKLMLFPCTIFLRSLQQRSQYSKTYYFVNPDLKSSLPFASFSLSSTREKASGASASPALTSKERFIRIVPESALRAWDFHERKVPKHWSTIEWNQMKRNDTDWQWEDISNEIFPLKCFKTLSLMSPELPVTPSLSLSMSLDFVVPH